jgi:hypothetical protein
MSEMFSQLVANPAIQPFLPFFFVFAIVYGLLSISPAFGAGKESQKVNLLISLVFAFFAAGYQPFVQFFFQNFGYILWFFVVMFFISFFMRALGLKGKEKASKERDYTKMIIFAGLILVFLATVGFDALAGIQIPVIGTENFIVLIGLLLLIIIFVAAASLGGGGAQQQPQQPPS